MSRSERAGGRAGRGRRRQCARHPGRRSGGGAWRRSTCPHRSPRRARASRRARSGTRGRGPRRTTPRGSGNTTCSKTTSPRRKATAARALAHGRLLFEELDDALGAGRGREDRVAQSGQPPDRAVQLAEVGEESQQATDRQPPLRELPRPHPDDEQCPGQVDALDQRREQRLQPRRRHLGGEAREVLSVEALDLELLSVVGLDEVRVGEALLGDRADGAAAPAFLARRLLDQAREPSRAEEEEWEDGQRHEGELPAEIEERAGEEDDAEQVGHGVGHPREHEALDRGDITGQSRDQVSEPAALEEVERQPLEMPEHAGSKREHEALADPRRPVVVDEPDEPAQQAQADERQRDPRGTGRSRAAPAPRRRAP